MEPTQALGFTHFLAQTDAVGKTILAILIAMSIASWYLIIVKSLQGLAAMRRTVRFLASFWNASSLHAVEVHLQNHHPDEPFSHLAYHAIASSRHHAHHGAGRLNEAGTGAEFLTRSMRRVIDEETARLESGLTVLYKGLPRRCNPK
jgi:biopolymer transport protein ExbB